MTNVNVSLPDGLQSFVDERAADQGFESSGDYIQDLIQRDREHLRALLLEGAQSPQTRVADDAYFAGLRDRIRSHRGE